MTITRRTALFAQIEQRTDEQLRERGIVVPSAMLALGVAAFGLRQRLTNASSCAA